jgi:hypothetical protein
MHAKLINLAYRADLAGFDDRPLRALFDEQCRDPKCVLEVSEFFFAVDGVPHLSCFVKWRGGEGIPSAGAGEPEAPRARARARKAGARPARPRRVEVPPAAEVTRRTERRDSEPVLSAAEAELYGTLRAWRRTKSESLGVPAFRVLTNKQLAAIARERPRDSDAFARLPGIGALRAENYGAEVLAMVTAGVT